MSAQPSLIEPPLVTVRQLNRLFVVLVRGVQVSLETSARDAAAKADRLRANPEEAEMLLAWTRENLG